MLGKGKDRVRAVENVRTTANCEGELERLRGTPALL